MSSKMILAIASSILFISVMYNQQQTQSVSEHFRIWKSVNHKVYSGIEETYRLEIFLQNYQIVEEHNNRYSQGLESFTMEMNKFADLSFEEFKAKYLYPEGHYTRIESAPKVVNNYKDVVPIDWRKKYPTWKARDQGSCFASFAMAVIGSIEVTQAIDDKSDEIVYLSAQELLDCVPGDGCQGNSVKETFEQILNKELHAEGDYPYTAVKGPECLNAQKGVGKVKVTAYSRATETNRDALVTALGGGPIVVAINVSGLSFQLYKDGIFTKPCSDNPNYDTLVVGYNDGTAPSGEIPNYELLMSWGTNWGRQGFIKLADNLDGLGKCGIYNVMSFPQSQSKV